MPASFPPSSQNVLVYTVPSGLTYMARASICTHLVPDRPNVLPIQDVSYLILGSLMGWSALSGTTRFGTPGTLPRGSRRPNRYFQRTPSLCCTVCRLVEIAPNHSFARWLIPWRSKVYQRS